jgi:shikimate dehydrogenase
VIAPPRYAVFGQPITHSLSPRIHAMFAAQFGIALDYRAIEVGREDFTSALDAFARDGGRGANVTLPLKERAFALCARTSEEARRAGSVNTLIRDGDEWRGDSTDGAGLLRDLHQRHGFEPHGRCCLVLGAGGAARAVAFALAAAGVGELVIANRTPERASALADAIGTAPRMRTCAWDELATMRDFDLVVNATAAGHAGNRLDLPTTLLAPATLCYDLSYGSPAIAFLVWARATGATRVSDGLGMLIEQAAESFALWHDQRPETAPVYAELRANPDCRSSPDQVRGRL